jgi:hypothetical protein
VIYRRINQAGDQYIGQAKSQQRFVARQSEHNRALAQQHTFTEVGSARPGLDLDILEQTQINRHGGVPLLQNKRNQMSAQRYIDSVRQRQFEYLRGVGVTSGLLNGTVHAANVLK